MGIFRVLSAVIGTCVIEHEQKHKHNGKGNEGMRMHLHWIS